MATQKSFWQRIGLQDWFLKDPNTQQDETTFLTPEEVYRYILAKFDESVKQLSFADRIVFFHEYIICFNDEDYRQFMANKAGLFGLIAHEAVKEFGNMLERYRNAGKTVVPSANKWVFRFVSHPEYVRGDMAFIGKLLPDASASQKDDNLRVTYIPRATGIAQTQDINEQVLAGFNYYSEGYYELPYLDARGNAGQAGNPGGSQARARLETMIPDKAYAGKKMEYLITEDDVTVSGSEAKEGIADVFRIPSDWVNTPHLRIRYDIKRGKFYLASFGEKTVLNEQEVPASTPDNPEWTELPLNSNIVLNGIVGINIFKA
jgi:hypothetical protein